jgi:hypothetical protein
MPPFGRREVVEHAVVQRDELLEEPAGRIQLEGQPPFGKVDLHAVGAAIETLPDVVHRFAHQIREKGVARVSGNARLRVEQAQGRR